MRATQSASAASTVVRDSVTWGVIRATPQRDSGRVAGCAQIAEHGAPIGVVQSPQRRYSGVGPRRLTTSGIYDRRRRAVRVACVHRLSIRIYQRRRILVSRRALEPVGGSRRRAAPPSARVAGQRGSPPPPSQALVRQIDETDRRSLPHALAHQIGKDRLSKTDHHRRHSPSAAAGRLTPTPGVNELDGVELAAQETAERQREELREREQPLLVVAASILLALTAKAELEEHWASWIGVLDVRGAGDQFRTSVPQQGANGGEEGRLASEKKGDCAFRPDERAGMRSPRRGARQIEIPLQAPSSRTRACHWAPRSLLP